MFREYDARPGLAVNARCALIRQDSDTVGALLNPFRVNTDDQRFRWWPRAFSTAGHGKCSAMTRATLFGFTSFHGPSSQPQRNFAFKPTDCVWRYLSPPGKLATLLQSPSRRPAQSGDAAHLRLPQEAIRQIVHFTFNLRSPARAMRAVPVSGDYPSGKFAIRALWHKKVLLSFSGLFGGWAARIIDRNPCRFAATNI